MGMAPAEGGDEEEIAQCSSSKRGRRPECVAWRREAVSGGAAMVARGRG
jgi:hypothetical protein